MNLKVHFVTDETLGNPGRNNFTLTNELTNFASRKMLLLTNKIKFAL